MNINFPFKINDKVRILYNKNLPERFKVYDFQEGNIVNFGYNKQNTLDSATVKLKDCKISVPIFCIEKNF